jgi:hypothetical protein
MIKVPCLSYAGIYSLGATNDGTEDLLDLAIFVSDMKTHAIASVSLHAPSQTSDFRVRVLWTTISTAGTRVKY